MIIQTICTFIAATGFLYLCALQVGKSTNEVIFITCISLLAGMLFYIGYFFISPYTVIITLPLAALIGCLGPRIWRHYK